MNKDLNLLGLDEQYTTFSYWNLNLPIVFPKTADKELIKYLVSLGYTCVLDKELEDPKQLGVGRLGIGICISTGENFTMQDVDKYLGDTKRLIPIEAYKKKLFISINGLYKIQPHNE